MDERKNDRVPLGLPIRLRISDIDAFTEEHTTDLSTGGIFVEMDDPPEPGTKVHLEFYLEAVQKSIWATGEVRRAVSGQGAGIEFVDIDTDGKRFIELVVEKYRRFHPDRVVSLCETIRERVNERLQLRPEERLLRGDQLEIRMRARSPMEFREENFEDLWNREIFIGTDSPLPLGAKLRLRVLFDEDDRQPGRGVRGYPPRELPGRRRESGPARHDPFPHGNQPSLARPARHLGRLGQGRAA